MIYIMIQELLMKDIGEDLAIKGMVFLLIKIWSTAHPGTFPFSIYFSSNGVLWAYQNG
jgi:hypothetical protein